MEKKFEVGNEVKVLKDNADGSYWKKGDTFIIIEEDEGMCFGRRKGSHSNFVREENLILVEEEKMKQAFKKGDRIEGTASCSGDRERSYTGIVVCDKPTKECRSSVPFICIKRDDGCTGGGCNGAWIIWPKGAKYLKLIEEAKISKYDEDTVRAIEKSIEHHEDNLDRLKKAKGRFLNNSGCLYGEISYGASVCALCIEFADRCSSCPLSLEGYRCNKEDSPWKEIFYSNTQDQAIAAEENMVKALESLLEREEVGFGVGDEVERIHDSHMGMQIGDTATIIKIDSQNTITLSGYSGRHMGQNLKLIKEKKEMSIKDKIENINEETTLKEWDDLKREVQGDYEVVDFRWSNGAGVITIYDGGPEGTYRFASGVRSFYYSADQCEMGKAQIKCLLWLEKSGKIKEEKTYKIGNRFGAIGGDKYILAQVGIGKVVLVGLQDGNRWNEEVEVKDVHKISQEEFKEITKQKIGNFLLEV